LNHENYYALRFIIGFLKTGWIKDYPCFKNSQFYGFDKKNRAKLTKNRIVSWQQPTIPGSYESINAKI